MDRGERPDAGGETRHRFAGRGYRGDLRRRRLVVGEERRDRLRAVAVEPVKPAQHQRQQHADDQDPAHRVRPIPGRERRAGMLARHRIGGLRVGREEGVEIAVHGLPWLIRRRFSEAASSGTAILTIALRRSSPSSLIIATGRERKGSLTPLQGCSRAAATGSAPAGEQAKWAASPKAAHPVMRCGPSFSPVTQTRTTATLERLSPGARREAGINRPIHRKVHLSPLCLR